MKIISICGALAIVCSSAFGAVSPKLAEWGDSPAKLLMTKDEAKKWPTLQTDEEAQAFIDLFWARRDPTPETMRNEFREDFEARVKFADDNFTTGKERGAFSDRGRTFIYFGPPFRVNSTGGPGSVSSGAVNPGNAPRDANGNLTVAAPVAATAQQTWMYAHDKKPKFLPQADFSIVFEDMGRNDYHLATTERFNPEAAFVTATNAFIVNPKITKAPVFAPPPVMRPVEFRNAALKATYEQFKAGDKDKVGAANLTWGEFVSSEGDHFVSAQMFAPEGSDLAPGQNVTFFSVLEKDGKIYDVREENTTLIAAGKDAYLDKSLDVEPGDYKATFGLVSADGKLLSATRTDMKIEGLDPKGTGTSPLLLASSIIPLKTTWHATDPFTFGGLKVIPQGDLAFPTPGDLWYFLEMRNPGTNETGTPNVKVQVDIKGKTTKGKEAELRMPLADAKLAKLSGETSRYALGLAIPLDAFKPGDYTIKIHVVDTVLGKNYDFEKPFHVKG
jgi:GWxTD domain-containing protein